MEVTLFMDVVATGGRLPQSWYYENYTNIDMSNMNMRPNASTGYPGRTYRFFTGTPLYEFGYGLSYSDFSYTRFAAPQSIMAPPLRHQLCSSDKAVIKSNLNCLDREKGERLWLILTIIFRRIAYFLVYSCQYFSCLFSAMQLRPSINI